MMIENMEKNNHQHHQVIIILTFQKQKIINEKRQKLKPLIIGKLGLILLFTNLNVDSNEFGWRRKKN